MTRKLENIQDTTPMSRLDARIDRNLAPLHANPEGAASETGAAIAGAMADVKTWMAEPGITWDKLAEHVSTELAAAITAHSASVTAGNEDIPAYARADGLSAVQSWMTELGGKS